MISACAESQGWEEALTILADMAANEVAPDIKSPLAVNLPALFGMEAVAIRLEAISSRLEAIACRLGRRCFLDIGYIDANRLASAPTMPRVVLLKVDPHVLSCFSKLFAFNSGGSSMAPNLIVS